MHRKRVAVSKNETIAMKISKGILPEKLVLGFCKSQQENDDATWRDKSVSGSDSRKGSAQVVSPMRKMVERARLVLACELVGAQLVESAM
jgi:hypothetical protein